MGLSCFRQYFLSWAIARDELCENNEGSCLNHYKFMVTMKYFDSNIVNFAEINSIGINVIYIQTLPFSAILWCFRAQTILWRRQFRHKIYRYKAIHLSELEHLWLSWLLLFFVAPHIRIICKCNIYFIIISVLFSIHNLSFDTCITVPCLGIVKHVYVTHQIVWRKNVPTFIWVMCKVTNLHPV